MYSRITITVGFPRDVGRVPLPWFSAIGVILRHGCENQRTVWCNFSIWTVDDVGLYKKLMLCQSNRMHNAVVSKLTATAWHLVKYRCRYRDIFGLKFSIPIFLSHGETNFTKHRLGLIPWKVKLLPARNGGQPYIFNFIHSFIHSYFSWYSPLGR